MQEEACTGGGGVRCMAIAFATRCINKKKHSGLHVIHVNFFGKLYHTASHIGMRPLNDEDSSR